MRLAVLFASAALAGCSFGDGSFRWYCEQLSSQPNTWTVTPTGPCGGLAQPFSLRFDQTASQPAGGGSACALSSWTYGTQQEGDHFGGTITSEWCSTTVVCVDAAGGSASGYLVVDRWDDVAHRAAGGWVTDAAGCRSDLSGAPR